MTENLLGISVVIPTRERVELLERLLCSLDEARTKCRHPVEILIVDDTPMPARQEIQQLCRNFQAKYLSGTPSVREKRNLGIKEARYPVVLFVDSDCEATPRLLDEHATGYQENDPSIAGVVGVTEFIGEDSWMWSVIERTQFLNAFSFAKRMEFAPWATCSNTSYRVSVLKEHGGFDTSFPFRLGGDDVDLGLRLNKAGYRLKCNPNAVVLHTRKTWNNLISMLRRAFRWGRMDVHVYYHKHNERIKFAIPKFAHIFLILAGVGLIDAVRIASFRSLTLPFIWAGSALIIQAIGTVFVTNEQWRYLPHELLADLLGLAFEFGALMEGIRCRETVVLYKTVQRGPVLPTFEQQEEVVQSWSMWLGIALTLLVQGVWKW